VRGSFDALPSGDHRFARTTLYRWTGDRDQLITDVLWMETKRTLDALAAAAAANGLPCQNGLTEWLAAALARSAV
jgi:hypothetical protein